MPSVLGHKVINEELFIHQLLVLSYHICKEKYYVRKTVKIQSVVQFIKSLVSRKYKIIWQQNAERKMLPYSLSLSLFLCLGERAAVISPSPTLIGSRCWCRPGQERKSFGKFSGLSRVFLGPGLRNQSLHSTGCSWGWSKHSYWPEIQTWASGADVLGKFQNPSRPRVKTKWKHLLAQLDSDQSLF